MTSEQSQAREESSSDKCNQWANPRSLIDGCDHRKKVKLSIDPDTLPDYNRENTVEEDLNWTIEALNAVGTYPNYVLSIRTGAVDAVFTYHYLDEINHERSGHFRVAIFENSEAPIEYTEEQEMGCGLLPFQEAVNLAYDLIAGAVTESSYSTLLIDIEQIEANDLFVSTHPIFTLDEDDDQHEHLIHWGRHNANIGVLPRGREKRHSPMEWAHEDDPYHGKEGRQTMEEGLNAVKDHYETGLRGEEINIDI